MACVCVKCGKPVNDCSEEYCHQCLMEWLHDDRAKNIKAGGRFYGEKLIRENEHTV